MALRDGAVTGWLFTWTIQVVGVDATIQRVCPACDRQAVTFGIDLELGLDDISKAKKVSIGGLSFSNVLRGSPAKLLSRLAAMRDVLKCIFDYKNWATNFLFCVQAYALGQKALECGTSATSLKSETDLPPQCRVSVNILDFSVSLGESPCSQKATQSLMSPESSSEPVLEEETREVLTLSELAPIGGLVYNATDDFVINETIPVFLDFSQPGRVQAVVLYTNSTVIPNDSRVIGEVQRVSIADALFYAVPDQDSGPDASSMPSWVLPTAVSAGSLFFLVGLAAVVIFVRRQRKRPSPQSSSSQNLVPPQQSQVRIRIPVAFIAWRFESADTMSLPRAASGTHRDADLGRAAIGNRAFQYYKTSSLGSRGDIYDVTCTAITAGMRTGDMSVIDSIALHC